MKNNICHPWIWVSIVTTYFSKSKYDCPEHVSIFPKSTIQDIFPQKFLYTYLFSPSNMKHMKHKQLHWVIICQTDTLQCTQILNIFITKDFTETRSNHSSTVCLAALGRKSARSTFSKQCFQKPKLKTGDSLFIYL
jgi:hypothetical protein